MSLPHAVFVDRLDGNGFVRWSVPLPAVIALATARLLRRMQIGWLHPDWNYRVQKLEQPVALDDDEPEPSLYDEDYDPTPYCAHCGAMKSANCHCGPISPDD